MLLKVRVRVRVRDEINCDNVETCYKHNLVYSVLFLAPLQHVIADFDIKMAIVIMIHSHTPHEKLSPPEGISTA